MRITNKPTFSDYGDRQASFPVQLGVFFSSLSCHWDESVAGDPVATLSCFPGLRALSPNLSDYNSQISVDPCNA